MVERRKGTVPGYRQVGGWGWNRVRKRERERERERERHKTL